jgi:protein kinase-like protein
MASLKVDEASDSLTPSGRDVVLLSDIPDPADLASGESQALSLEENFPSDVILGLRRQYEFLATLGRGGLGEVYKVKHLRTGEILAVKILKQELSANPQLVGQFKNGVLMARAISHKNVCRICDCDVVAGVAFAATEFVDGGNLRSTLGRLGKIPLRWAIDITFQFCSALKQAHEQGIVHGGLKLENMFIDSQGNAKITDFVVAGLTASAAYRAPEQAAGKSADRRTDIYTLGLVLQDLFTGKSDRRNRNEEPPPGKEPAMPVSIERAIQKCLEPDPANRFQSIEEFETALNSAGIRAALASSTGPGPTLTNREALAKARKPDSPTQAASNYRLPTTLVGLMLGTLGIIGIAVGVRWVDAAAGAKIPAPRSLPAPLPPAFALEQRMAQKTIRSGPGGSNLRGSTAKSAGQTASLGDGLGQNYLWIGRFEEEDLAREAAVKIEQLGLPAVIVPKHSHSSAFFVLLSGPFHPDKLEESAQELEHNGFADIHLIKNLTIDERLSP